MRGLKAVVVVSAGIAARVAFGAVEVRAALADAFKCASSDRETAEPLDWFETRQPRRWRFADGTAAEYDWQESAGTGPAKPL